MTNLYLIRHGAYIFNDKELPYDRGLSAEGIGQADLLKERLAATSEIKVDILISSPAPRAIQTAQIIAPALGVAIEQDEEIEEWRNLNEQNLGQDLGAELRATDYNQRTFYLPGPGCETYAQFIYRACTALNRIIEYHTGKSIIVVCHGGIVEASFHLFYGFSPFQPTPVTMLLDPAYTSITHWRKVKVGTDQWMLCEYNDTAHLPRLFAKS
jgi:probable phosphoglycerate mutase